MVFCYDGPVQKDESNNHYSLVINDLMFNRYLSTADEIVATIRVEPLSGANSRFIPQITQNKVRIREIPNISTVTGILFSRINAKKILLEEFILADYAIIRLPSMIGIIAVRLMNQLKKPYIIEVVGCPWDSYWNYGAKGKIIAPFVTHIIKQQVYDAKYVIYVTNQFLQKRYPTSGKSINCSNVEIGLSEDFVLTERLQKIRRNQDYKLLGTAAAVNVPYKGHEFVIKALSVLKKQGRTNYIYQLAGGGDQERLKKIASKFNVNNQIQFLGALSRDALFKWLDQIDIYIQPSRQEGLPRALIEAMSRGAPCIGSYAGGIPELLEDEVLFSTSNDGSSELSNMLYNYSEELMVRQAMRNYLIAKSYQKDLIQNRRLVFLTDFLNSIKANP